MWNQPKSSNIAAVSFVHQLTDFERRHGNCAPQKTISKRKIENVRRIREDNPKTKGKMNRHKTKKEKPKYEFDEEPNIWKKRKTSNQVKV